MISHLRIFFRNLRRNITYSGINIAGLAISMTAFVLIFLWVYHYRYNCLDFCCRSDNCIGDSAAIRCCSYG